MSLKALSLTLLATVHATPFEKVARDECKPCNPQGATGTAPPAIGPELKSLYVNVLASVKDIHFRKRWNDAIHERADGFCCRETLDCVNVQGLNIPMCYDKFTTQFAFPDNSHGSLTTGEYTSSGGSTANLLTGEYTKEGGEQANIYAQDQQAKPNTATLSIPPQWTAAGVGSAIPANELGSVVVYTTTIPGTTYTAPTVIPESTLVETHGDHTTTVSTIPAQTITAPTTVAPVTSTVTETKSVAAASSTGAAAHVVVDSANSWGFSLLSALMYAIYAL